MTRRSRKNQAQEFGICNYELGMTQGHQVDQTSDYITSSALIFSQISRCSVSSLDVSGGQLLEGRGNVLIAANDELHAGDVVGNLLGLSKLSGQGTL